MGISVAQHLEPRRHQRIIRLHTPFGGIDERLVGRSVCLPKSHGITIAQHVGWFTAAILIRANIGHLRNVEARRLGGDGIYSGNQEHRVGNHAGRYGAACSTPRRVTVSTRACIPTHWYAVRPAARAPSTHSTLSSKKITSVVFVPNCFNTL